MQPNEYASHPFTSHATVTFGLLDPKSYPPHSVTIASIIFWGYHKENRHRDEAYCYTLAALAVQ